MQSRLSLTNVFGDARQQHTSLFVCSKRPKSALVCRCEHRSDAGGFHSSSEGARSAFQTRRLYSLMGQEQRAGSERGEGFVNFLLSGPVRMDVDTLNDQMRPAGALRLRHAQARSGTAQKERGQCWGAVHHSADMLTSAALAWQPHSCLTACVRRFFGIRVQTFQCSSASP
jgi:hypothetical protein